MGHLHNGILPSCKKKKKKEILLFATACVDLENSMLSVIASQRKTNTIWFHSCVKSNEQTELTRAMETESQMESRMTAGVGRLGGGGIDKK